ncbi:MAG: type II toxin-antitoxin system VapC family toxin [Planctomycetota bacterium]|jgi:hypothetical protein
MSKKASVYIETTIPSYLTARPSNNLIIAGEQEVTRQWWEIRRGDFDLYISELVLEEAQCGDAGHIALATRHEVDYLLTWNCTHIANAETIRSLSYVINEAGYSLPVICTPLELFGGEPDA